MWKKILLLLSVFCVISCTSIPKHSTVYYSEDYLEQFCYEIRDVDVSIDYVNEAVIAEQVKILLESITNRNQNIENKVFIDFNVLQRSFIQDINQKTTIYINVAGYNSNNEILFRENYYLTGKETFLSSVTQYRCVNYITKKLSKYQESIEKKIIQRDEKANKIQ